jgi:hypothetical protein
VAVDQIEAVTGNRDDGNEFGGGGGGGAGVVVVVVIMVVMVVVVVGRVVGVGGGSGATAVGGGGAVAARRTPLHALNPNFAETLEGLHDRSSDLLPLLETDSSDLDLYFGLGIRCPCRIKL